MQRNRTVILALAVVTCGLLISCEASPTPTTGIETPAPVEDTLLLRAARLPLQT
jgi:hypothetical protein